MKISLDYLAGLIDGEGTITLAKSSKSPYRHVTVSVQMCDEDLIRALQENFGGVVTTRASRRPNHNQAFTWKVQYKKAVELLVLLKEKLILGSKKVRASYIADNYPILCRKNGKYTQEEHERRLKFDELFFSLTPTRMSPISPSSSFEALVIT